VSGLSRFDKLRTVTPDARGKDRFIIVDATGVCEQDKTDSHSLNTKPSAKLEELLNYVAQGGIDPDALTTLAGRLARLQRQFTPAQLVELANLAGGKSFPELARDLIDACDPDSQIEAAKKATGVEKPTEEQVKAAAEQLGQSAATPFMKAAFRSRILESGSRMSRLSTVTQLMMFCIPASTQPRSRRRRRG